VYLNNCVIFLSERNIMIRGICVGNLVTDPELKYVGPNNSPLVATRIACQSRSTTVFMDIEFWGKTAEVIAQYGHKGSCIAADCRIKVDEWEGEDGRKNRKYVLSCEEFNFVGGGKKEKEEE
jgi:single-strand DNA-binding protein